MVRRAGLTALMGALMSCGVHNSANGAAPAPPAANDEAETDPPRPIGLADGQDPVDERAVVARLFDGRLLLYRASSMLKVPTSVPGVGLRRPDGSYRWRYLHSASGDNGLNGFGEGWTVYAQRGELVVGVLDWMTGDSGEHCRPVYSEDRGASWYRAGLIRKPHYMALCERLQLRDGRRWRLTIHLEDCADCGIELGRYVHETRDAGRSWKLTARP